MTLAFSLQDMLFDFHWNSFFHAQVQNCVSLILRNTPVALSEPINVAVDHPLLHQVRRLGGS